MQKIKLTLHILFVHLTVNFPTKKNVTKIVPKMSDALIAIFIESKQSCCFLENEIEAITSARPVLLNGGRKADFVGTEFLAFKDMQHCDDDRRSRDKKAFVGVQQRISVLSSEV